MFSGTAPEREQSEEDAEVQEDDLVIGGNDTEGGNDAESGDEGDGEEEEEEEVYLEGELAGDILRSESCWHLEPSSGRLELLLHKQPIFSPRPRDGIPPVPPGGRGGRGGGGARRDSQTDQLANNQWTRLLATDDALTDGDMDHDLTDLARDEYRERRDARVRVSEVARRETALRAELDAAAASAGGAECGWSWQLSADRSEVLPSYLVG